ncbi:RNA polymerase sigma factor [Coralloluteibacterium stylophorae]|uniref:RNA polymerase sigma factor n=1 Tax=Coralloluteibacterium stylophorae TaxID=1776034 RepID=A0AAP2C851_9GAMM|nr:RNA polymerase sigma factor [Coralloluteibacterium stylophorae]MBS7455645.1 RNA polymerase sigma factor [Coralloluteibacterium stylophorae]
MTEDPSDETLMLAYAEGVAGAFDALYRRHRGPLFRFIQRSLGDREASEEVFQDVWQRVVAARSRYRTDARFTTWLYQIAHNRLGDHWRARRVRPGAPEDAETRLGTLADASTPDAELGEFERRRRLQIALAELPAEQRETLLLRLDQCLSLEAIAAITGVGAETAKSRLRYAVDKLRARLAP